MIGPSMPEENIKTQTLFDLALEIADSNAGSTIKCNCVPVTLDGDCWYDTEPEKDELSAEIEYCELRGLLVRHPKHLHYVQTLEP